MLPANPFAGAITARNGLVLDRLASWATASREAAQASIRRLRARSADEHAGDWELAALGTAAREWRVFEAFRALHERARCPGLLFRLQSRTDFLTLCDRRADSSPSGYGERQRRVLAKRGIVCRRSWAAARALVAEVGLLDDPAPPAAGDDSGTGDSPPDAPADPRPEEGGGEGDELAPAEDAVDAPLGCESGLPVLVYSPVWHTLGTLPKARLASVIEEYGVGLWAQFGGRFYGSMRKAEMLEHARRVVRHHAALDAAQRLDEQEVERLYDWMRGRLGADAARSADLQVAARLFRDFLAAAALSADGRGLSPRAWNRYRDAELRRIGAFCFGAFYEEAGGDEVGLRAQVSAAEAP